MTSESARQRWFCGSPKVGFSDRPDRWRSQQRERDILVVCLLGWLPGQKLRRDVPVWHGGQDYSPQVGLSPLIGQQPACGQRTRSPVRGAVDAMHAGSAWSPGSPFPVPHASAGRIHCGRMNTRTGNGGPIRETSSSTLRRYATTRRLLPQVASDSLCGPFGNPRYRGHVGFRP